MLEKPCILLASCLIAAMTTLARAHGRAGPASSVGGGGVACWPGVMVIVLVVSEARALDRDQVDAAALRAVQDAVAHLQPAVQVAVALPRPGAAAHAVWQAEQRQRGGPLFNPNVRSDPHFSRG